MGDMYRVRATVGGYSGGPGLSTFYFLPAGATSTAEATECVARVQAFFVAAQSLYFTACSIQVSGAVDVLESGTGVLTNAYSVANPVALAGTGGANNTAIATAVLLTHNTAGFSGGRRVKGRTFLSPLSISVISASGQVTSTAQNAAVTAGGKLGTVVVTSTVTPVVWSRPKTSPVPSPGAALAISSWTSAAKPAVLRSRRD